MKLDQTFKTFDEFRKFLLQWQEDTFQTFTIMKSDMFTVAEKARETLVYKKVIYGCAHGTQRKQQSQGSRPQQRTRKLDCPVSFTIKGRKRSGLLTITEEPTQQHSHALGQELWQHWEPQTLGRWCSCCKGPALETRVSSSDYEGHLFGCLENQRLTQFPGPEGKERVVFTGNDNKVEIRIPKLWHKFMPIDVPSKSKPPSKKAKKWK